MAIFNSHVKLPEGTSNSVTAYSQKYQKITYTHTELQEDQIIDELHIVQTSTECGTPCDSQATPELPQVLLLSSA